MSWHRILCESPTDCNNNPDKCLVSNSFIGHGVYVTARFKTGRTTVPRKEALDLHNCSKCLRHLIALQ